MDQMPELKHFYKQPDETFFVDADFVDVLTTGETITIGTSTITAVDSQGAEATDNVLSIGTKYVLDLTKLAVRVLAGTEALSPYKLTFKIITSLNNTWEVDVELRVEEI